MSGTLSITDSSLTVINDGPALVAGDSFKLFSQAVASGSFTNVVLPGGLRLEQQAGGGRLD